MSQRCAWGKVGAVAGQGSVAFGEEQPGRGRKLVEVCRVVDHFLIGPGDGVHAASKAMIALLPGLKGVNEYELAS